MRKALAIILAVALIMAVTPAAFAMKGPQAGPKPGVRMGPGNGLNNDQRPGNRLNDDQGSGKRTGLVNRPRADQGSGTETGLDKGTPPNRGLGAKIGLDNGPNANQRPGAKIGPGIKKGLDNKSKPNTKPARKPVAKPRGEGRLAAKGQGSFVMEASATVELTGIGDLVLETTGTTESTATVRFAGKVKSVTKDGDKTVYKGFNGRVVIKGMQFKLAFTGRANSLFAQGKGKAVFKGRWFLITKGKPVPIAEDKGISIEPPLRSNDGEGQAPKAEDKDIPVQQ